MTLMLKRHFLQSEAWEKFQNTLGKRTIRRQGDGWSYLAIVERSAGLTRLYCPYGPTAESAVALSRALDALKVDGKNQGAAYLRIQPLGVDLNTTKVKGYRLHSVDYSQPEATRLIDLDRPLEDIYIDISQSKRSICRNYRNKGLAYSSSRDPKDIEKLLPLLHEVAARNKISIHDDDYLRRLRQY